MIWTVGQCATETRQGSMVILTKCPPVSNLSCQVVVGWKDSRAISEQQRHIAWALITEIGEWIGTKRQKLKGLNAEFKMKFLLEYFDQLSADCIKRFSLSDCDMTTARLYIDYLIDFVITNGIPTKKPLAEQAQDIEHYVYSCLMNKRCVVCQKKADLHHCEGSKIGMGNDRRKVNHLGRTVMPLCRLHHGEIDQIGHTAFCDKYHVTGIPADKKICTLYGLNMRGEAK